MGHPLMFVFRDVVSGRGFLAGITISGKSLMKQEGDGKWWMYGVRPGAIAECGSSPHELLLRFKTSYLEVIFDIAEDSCTFEDFKKEVEHFYYEPDFQEEKEWERALDCVRSGEQTPHESLADLPRYTPETRPAQITVENLSSATRRMMPSDNVTDSYLLPAAA